MAGKDYLGRLISALIGDLIERRKTNERRRRESDLRIDGAVTELAALSGGASENRWSFRIFSGGGERPSGATDLNNKLVRYRRHRDQLLDEAFRTERMLTTLRMVENHVRDDIPIAPWLIGLKRNLLDREDAEDVVRRVCRHVIISQRNRPWNLMPTPPGVGRIFLPISLRHVRAAKALGAQEDTRISGVEGSTSVYVTPHVLADRRDDFENMLPLMYRAGAPNLSFAPIPKSAGRLNVWSLFGKNDWDIVSSGVRLQRGMRCLICGGVSTANPARRLAPEHAGYVHCHEIWEWEPCPENPGAGYQTLRRLLSVCADCHSLFHIDRETDVGFMKSLSDRRGFLTGIPAELVDYLIEEEGARARELSGIDKWVVDLGHLSQQEYVRDMRLRFVTDNPKGVSETVVANLSFETDMGEIMPSVDRERAMSMTMGAFGPESPEKGLTVH
jgi:hypothetical protein